MMVSLAYTKWWSGGWFLSLPLKAHTIYPLPSLLLWCDGVVDDSANKIAKPSTHSNEGTFSIHNVVEWWLIPFTATKSPYQISSILIATMMWWSGGWFCQYDLKALDTTKCSYLKYSVSGGVVADSFFLIKAHITYLYCYYDVVEWWLILQIRLQSPPPI